MSNSVTQSTIKQPNIHNSAFYTFSWIGVACFSLLTAMFTVIVTTLGPIGGSDIETVKLFGLWVPGLVTNSAAWTLYLSISLTLISFGLTIFMLSFDQRTYRFNASAPFMRVAFFTCVLSLLAFISGAISQPSVSSDYVTNMLWANHNGHVSLTTVGIIVIVIWSLYGLYFAYEFIIGYVHTVLLRSRISLINPNDIDLLTHVYANHKDSVTLMYGKIFVWWHHLKKRQQFQNKLSRWYLVNKYVFVNIVYSSIFITSIIFWILYGCLFRSDNPLDTQNWFWVTFTFWILSFIFLGTLIINTTWSLRRCRKYDKYKQRKDYLSYAFAICVPFLGAITEIKYRRNEFAHKREQILIKRKRRVHMIVFITFFNVISLIMASSIVVLGSFLGASLTVKYNPTPYSFKKLDVSDNRIGNLQEQYQAMTLNKTGSTDPRIYSALTYNTGFNAYNHNMHFFMDEDGHFFNGQSRAESAVAISQSINGIARTLGSDHDTAIEGEYNYNWNDGSTVAANLRGVRDIQQTKFENDETQLNYGNWISDDPVYYSAIDPSENIFAQSTPENLLADNTLGTTTGLFDFLSFEELDQDSTRSWFVPEYDTLRNASVMQGYGNTKNFINMSQVYASNYAYNYVIPLVPMPLNQMTGKVMGGMATMSRFAIQDSQRFALPSLGGILGLYQLRRCLSINQIAIVDNNGNPILGPQGNPIHFTYITGHLDAYDNGGTVRRVQLQGVNQIFENELFTHDANGKRTGETGNYVLMGADWNLLMPQTKDYEGDNTDDDPAIVPWNFAEYKSGADVSKGGDESNWVSYNSYDVQNQYKNGDVVRYDVTNSDLDDVAGIPGSGTSKHDSSLSPYTDFNKTDGKGTTLYQAIGNVPNGESPLKDDELNNQYWRYFIHHVAKGTSITREARRNYIPVADSDKKIVPISNVQQAEPLDNYRGATFYSTHATPTARQAGESYDGSNQNVTTSDLNIFKFNIDGFLASYNIDVDSTFSFDNNFIYSDHMPVAIKFSLKAPSQNY